jgi:hypothetical protein
MAAIEEIFQIFQRFYGFPAGNCPKSFICLLFRKFPETFWELPETFWESPKTFWELPETFWESPKTFWESPKTFWELPKTFWELPKIPPLEYYEKIFLLLTVKTFLGMILGKEYSLKILMAPIFHFYFQQCFSQPS